MNKSIKTGIGLTLLTAAFIFCGSFASMQTMTTQTGTIGNMSREEFDRRNKEGAANVAAITATGAPLSKDDQKMMMEVAMGGMMQLEVSRAALDKVTNEEARILAQSEVEEQTGLAAKLQEIASAKGVTLPTAPDSKTRSMVAKMQNMAAGMNFDRNYVKESGVKGHEKLDKTMSKVQSKATDPALKGLASAALPLVRTHLEVSRAVVSKMSDSGNSRMMNGNSSNSNSMSDGNSMMNSNSMNSNSMNSNSMNSNMRTNRNSNMNMNSNSNSTTNMNMNSNRP
jgi:putative membrane protein